MTEFPKWVFPDAPETTRGKIVNDAAEEAAHLSECQGTVLNGDTSHTPDDAIEEASVEAVRAKLDAAGITYDQRWGLKRLKALRPE
jgi:hypothetical protein